MDNTILVSGITGELGTAMAERMTGIKQTAVVIIRRPQADYKTDLSPFDVLNIDIRDREELLRHADRLKGKVNTVVHMATLRHGARKKDLVDTILKGTLNLYELANEIGCRKFINFSSILAAGWAPRNMDRLDETYLPDASRLCYYGKMKLEAEMRLAKLSSDKMTKVVTLRPGNVYGPPKLSFIRFIADMIKRRDKVFYQRAKGSVMWAPIHTQDVLDCVFMLAGRERFDNGLYFLTGDEPATLEELTAIVSGQIGAGTGLKGELGVMEKLHLAIRRIPDCLREIAGRPSFPDFVYSNQNIKNNLGFCPRRRLKEGIAETIAWAKGKGIL